MPNHSDYAISVDNLVKKFGARIAVNKISFKVAKGTIFGLLGSNGAGKSTTLKLLTTLLKPTTGSACVAGFDILKQPAKIRAAIGYVPQSFSADAELTGYENLLISAKLYDIPAEARERRIKELLSLMELEEARDKLVNFYSGGMLRKLEIAQALLHKPSILFLDEPTIGLDPIAKKTIWKHIVKLKKELQTTIIITTHDMEEAEKLCDSLCFMSKGLISTIGKPAHLKKSLGKKSNLDDVFTHYSSNSIIQEGNFESAKQTRKVFARV